MESINSIESKGNELPVDDAEEEECRVCRGPAEPDHPLFKPCKCRGSIGLTHQDCLQSWLQIQRRNRCELCRETFRFAPLYAEGTPERLSVLNVTTAVFQRAIAKWLPFLIRLLFCASLWLVVAPLVSSYLYRAWMHRPGAVLQRLQWSLLPQDIVSGAVVVAFIIISFLSLMSFADFIRFELRQPRRRQIQQRQGPEEPQLQPETAEIEEHFMIVAQQHHQCARQSSLDQERHEETKDNSSDDDESEDSTTSWQEQQEEDLFMIDDDSVNDHLGPLQPLREEEDDEPGVLVNNNNNNNNNNDADEAAQPLPRPPRNMDNDEDPVDMDINIALDELLGVRGPISVVIRNLLWLLAFNAIYLGFFAFTPRTVGATICAMFFNTTNIFWKPINETETMLLVNSTEHVSVFAVLRAVEAASDKANSTFRLGDVVVVTLGYLAFACFILFIKSLVILSGKIRLLRAGRGRPRTGNPDRDEVRDALDEINRIMLGGNANDIDQMNDDEQGVALAFAVGLALETAVVTVKIGILLLGKMFLLPIGLGLCLDACTLSLLGNTIGERIAYAGSDLFSFLLLHWVAGITFMLLVTVSVLQLREVAHPDLLAQMIRPQEPQPDLLGNLLHDSVPTHTKRMVLSLVIYALLLAFHIYLPLNLLIATGMTTHFPKFKFSYLVMPQLQVPLELLFFHLCMLGILEKNKNLIGELQHHWLKVICRCLGLVDSVLPLSVAEFRLIGSRAVFQESTLTVEPFWIELSKFDDPESLINANLKHFVPRSGDVVLNRGETKPNGERVLRFGCDYVRLPVRDAGEFVLLQTKLGRYRLKRDGFSRDDESIQLWEEVPGGPIARPPEGWDDLGAGGADVQGRWAWGKERKSTLERGVARRRSFYDTKWSLSLACVKILVLILLAWVTTTLLLCFTAFVPWALGRMLYSVFRVPDSWIHDPFGFAVGSLLFFPSLRYLLRTYLGGDFSLSRRVCIWLSRWQRPPIAKVTVVVSSAVLYFGLSPMLLGTIVDIAIMKPVSWFLRNDDLVDSATIILDWALGTVLLLIGAYLCVIGFLTKNFWARIFDGGGGIDGEAQPSGPQTSATSNASKNYSRPPWQGKNGRIRNFFDAWRYIVQFEWDKVDAEILLYGCALPISRALALTLLVPMICLALCSWYIVPLDGHTRMTLTRMILALIASAQVAWTWRQQAYAWFEAAHALARDDLYLVGEVLLDFDEVAH